MMALLLPLILLALVVSSVSSARIAGFMALGGSQYINMKHIMEELASRGHQVHNSQYNLRPLFVCHVQAKVVDAISRQTGRFVMPYFKLTY